jgi:cytochrome c oxidase assembly protein subunit 23
MMLIFVDNATFNQFINSPCAAAAKASMDCLDRNNYDRSSCVDFFQAYKDCKKTWARALLIVFLRSHPSPQVEQRKSDRRAGRPTA